VVPVTLQINGEARSFERELTVEELLHVLAVQVPAFVVELNRSIVPRSAYTIQRLNDGDRVEIVTFVGGG
jgi:thiamine biosynthesis protein ThiS